MTNSCEPYQYFCGPFLEKWNLLCKQFTTQKFLYSHTVIVKRLYLSELLVIIVVIRYGALKPFYWQSRLRIEHVPGFRSLQISVLDSVICLKTEVSQFTVSISLSQEWTLGPGNPKWLGTPGNCILHALATIYQIIMKFICKHNHS